MTKSGYIRQHGLIASRLTLGLLISASTLLTDASAATLNGAVAENATGSNVNLTTLGTRDWAVWGYGTGGTSTSLSPDVRLSGGSAISTLTDINPGSDPLRGLGQFPGAIPYSFNWTNGAPTASATGAATGLQHNTSGTATLGNGFSFTVPADVSVATLVVYAAVHQGTARLTAHLSDSSAPDLTINTAVVGNNIGERFTLSFASATAGQTLTVTYVTTSDAAGQCCTNSSIYAAALSAPATPPVAAPTLSEWGVILMSGALAIFGFFHLRRRENHTCF